MIEALVLALALAMDAFAVALAQGARFRPGAIPTLVIAGAFGLAQGGMALAGWALGSATLGFVEAVDHWIAFVLLALIGAQMIRGSGDDDDDRRLVGGALIVTAFATSIDAFAAGITLPTLDVPVGTATAWIAGVTFVLSLVAALSGRAIGAHFGRPAEIAGGLALIALGAKIVLEHTGVI